MKLKTKVSACMTVECAYNANEKCHAIAVNIGQDEPFCDTYYESSQKCIEADITALVGACKTDTCMFNECLVCSAEGIHVSRENGSVKCLTFQQR